MVEERANGNAFAVDPSEGMMGDGQVWCGWWFVCVVHDEGWERKEVDRSSSNDEYAVVRKEDLDAVV